MIELPLVVLILFFVVGVACGFIVERWTDDGRRRRALAKAAPVWEVHVGSDGTRDDSIGYVGTGRSVVVSVRKVRRAGQHSKVMQRIEVARVPADGDPGEILTAVDRAQEMAQTLALTGAA